MHLLLIFSVTSNIRLAMPGNTTYLTSQQSTWLAIFTSTQIVIGGTVNLFIIAYFLFFYHRKQRMASDKLTLNLAISDFIALATYLPWRTHVLILRRGTENAYIYTSLCVLGIFATGNAIICIALDRFTAAVWPLRYKILITSRVTTTAIGISWFEAILLAVLHGFVYEDTDDYLHDDYELFLTSLSFAQLLILTAIYSALLRIARKHTKIRSNLHGRRRSMVFLRKSIFTAFTIMCLFYITFLPYCIYRVYSRLDKGLTNKEKHAAWRWLTAFSFVNSCCNPFVYIFAIEKHRTNFKKFFRAFCKGRADSPKQAAKCNDIELEQVQGLVDIN